MVIPRSILDEMIAHAREGAPEEICGILGGIDDTVSEIHRITNVEHSPTLYVMHAQEQLDAFMAVENAGLDVLVVYHSHPATEPKPSATDIRLAAWPGVRYAIVSLRDPTSPEIQLWSIEGGEVAELTITSE